MNKARKDELKKKYLRQELEKLADGENRVMASWANLKLQKPLPPLTQQTISETPADALTEVVLLKVELLISGKLQSEWVRYKTRNQVLADLSAGIRMVVCTTACEMMAALGDGQIPLPK
jgi:hypothetical protein